MSIYSRFSKAEIAFGSRFKRLFSETTPCNRAWEQDNSTTRPAKEARQASWGYQESSFEIWNMQLQVVTD
jgi:hypothetical protein